MSTIGPTNPYHVASAYGVQPPTAPKPALPAAGAHGVDETAGPRRAADGPVFRIEPTPVDRLVAGRVPGGVEFAASGAAAQPSAPEALPFYRHPADRNAAATGIAQAGRRLDVSG